MATETIYKLQPHRTVALRGFDRRGAAATIHSASASGFKCTGVFRDFADVAVIDLWNADAQLEHYTLRPLPDFDFSGITLQFDLNYNGTLQPIDSPKSPWQPWHALSYRKVSDLAGTDDTGGTIPLFDHATLQGGTFSTASASWTITTTGTVDSGDMLSFFYRGLPFQLIGSSGGGPNVADYTYFTQGSGYDHYVQIAGMNLPVTMATNTTPIQITTGAAHGLSTGDVAIVSDCLGNTAANGSWFVTVVDATNFTLDSSAGNGFYGGGGSAGKRREYAYTEGSGEYGVDVAIQIAAAAASDPWASIDNHARAIIGATNATPIKITTSTNHNLSTGYVVRISGVGGNTAANGVHFVTKVNDTEFTLDGSAGNGAYTSGGAVDGSNHVWFSKLTPDPILKFSASDGNANVTLTTSGAIKVARDMATMINTFDWINANPSMAILAEALGPVLTIRAARYGRLNVAGDGHTCTIASGSFNFTGLTPGSPIFIDGDPCFVGAVIDAQTITLQSPGYDPGVTNKSFLCERGGQDGNMITVQARAKGNIDMVSSVPVGAFTQRNQQLSGGSSNATWRITLNFAALGLDKVRQLWLTLAPQLTDGLYSDTEFTAEFSNWTVTDASSHRALKVAGRGSVRVGSRSEWANYLGTSWSKLNINSGWFWQGYAREGSDVGDSIVLKYSCGSAHAVYLGTSLYTNRGIVSISLDGGTPVTFDAYAQVSEPTLTRRKIFSSVAAGQHNVVITITGKRGPSSGTAFLFDYLEAAIPSDVIDAPVTTTTASLAIDFDTDHTYKMTPQRLVWNFERLGFRGHINEYLGVFWWNQRRRVAGTNNVYTVTFGGAWSEGDTATITISGVASIRMLWPSSDVDVNPKIARTVLATSLAETINTTFIGVWAEVTGVDQNVLVIHTRTPMFFFPVSISKDSSDGTMVASGNLDPGSEGIWEIDPTAADPINKAARDWHEDFMSEVEAAGLNLTMAASMELLNPPEYPGDVYAARYPDGIRVLTAVGFGSEGAATIRGATNANPIVIHAPAHGYDSGDIVTNTGVLGNTAANGTWTITVTDADHFSIPATGNGSFVPFAWGVNEVIPQAVRNLRTTHCTFSPQMLAHQQSVFTALAEMMDAAALTPWLQFGEFTWWYFSRHAMEIGFASWTSPISIGTAVPHGLSTGDRVIVSGVRGNTAANGTHAVTVTDSTHFTLDGSSGNGDYAGGGRISYGGMAYYDDETTTDAAVALSRPLAQFDVQDDDPALNSYEDADFLQDRLKTFIDDIRTVVLAAVPGAKFELLFPFDVNFTGCYHPLDYPYPQGGRLNAHVNFPAAYTTKSGSGLDRIKLEGLSWGATYRNLDNAKHTIRLLTTFPHSWDPSDVHYLIPFFNGACPWPAEFLYAVRSRLSQVAFWAFDHYVLLSWPALPLPTPRNAAWLT